MALQRLTEVTKKSNEPKDSRFTGVDDEKPRENTSYGDVPKRKKAKETRLRGH